MFYISRFGDLIQKLRFPSIGKRKFKFADILKKKKYTRKKKILPFKFSGTFPDNGRAYYSLTWPRKRKKMYPMDLDLSKKKRSFFRKEKRRKKVPTLNSSNIFDINIWKNNSRYSPFCQDTENSVARLYFMLKLFLIGNEIKKANEEWRKLEETALNAESPTTRGIHIRNRKEIHNTFRKEIEKKIAMKLKKIYRLSFIRISFEKKMKYLIKYYADFEKLLQFKRFFKKEEANHYRAMSIEELVNAIYEGNWDLFNFLLSKIHPDDLFSSDLFCDFNPDMEIYFEKTTILKLPLLPITVNEKANEIREDEKHL